MTFSNIAKILLNMKSSWFSDQVLASHFAYWFIVFYLKFLFTQPRPGSWHWPVPKEGHQEDVEEEDSEEVQGQAFPEGELLVEVANIKLLLHIGDDNLPKLQRFFRRWSLFLVSDRYLIDFDIIRP